MKRLFTLINLLLFASSLTAQTTTVSATVVDSDSITWANGSWGLTFTPNPNNPNPNIYNINGTPLSPSVTAQGGSLDSSGALSFSVYQTATIAPAGSSWTLKVCPNAVTACGIYNFTAVGTTMDLSSVLTSIIPVPRYHAISGTYGYTDNEAVLQLIPGNTYWNVTTNEQRWWTGTEWITWSGGGGGSCPDPIAGDGWAQFSVAGACAGEFINYNISDLGFLTESVESAGGDGIILDPNFSTGGQIILDSREVGSNDEGSVTIFAGNEDNSFGVDAFGTSTFNGPSFNFCGWDATQVQLCDDGVTTTVNFYGEVNATYAGSGATEFYTNGGLELQNIDGGSGFFQSFPLPLNFEDSPITLDYGSYFEPVDATDGNVVINLDQICPLPSSYCNDGLIYLFTKEDASGNTVTINAYSGQTINGSPSVALTSQFQAVELIADYNGDVGGTPSWIIKNQSGSGSSFITSLTTTGTSGPATVVSGVLNIPDYSGTSSTPTLGSCGTGTPTLSGNASLFEVNNIASGTTYCTVTFSPSLSAAVCLASSDVGFTEINPISTASVTFILYATQTNLYATCGGGGTGGGGSGTVTNFASGNLSPLFTTSVANSSTTPTQSFTLSTATANFVFANCTGSTAAPSFCALTSAMIPNNAANTSGNAATATLASTATVATDLSPYPTKCTGSQFSQGLSSGSNNCATPASVYPGGTGIPEVTGGVSWGSTYNASNTIPFNFLTGVDAAGAAAARAAASICASGQYSTGTSTSTTPCAQVAYSQLSGAPIVITPVQLIMPTSTINANTCTTPASVTMTGLILPSGGTPGSTFSVSYEGNPTSVTGWGFSGGLSLKLWVSASNTMQWSVCNSTGSNITPGSLNVDVGAR